jgi:hypothetical protein
VQRQQRLHASTFLVNTNHGIVRNAATSCNSPTCPRKHGDTTASTSVRTAAAEPPRAEDFAKPDNYNDALSTCGNSAGRLLIHCLFIIFDSRMRYIQYMQRTKHGKIAQSCRVSCEKKYSNSHQRKRLLHLLVSASLHLLIIRRFDVLKRHRRLLHSRSHQSVQIHLIHLCKPVVTIILRQVLRALVFARNLVKVA